MKHRNIILATALIACLFPLRGIGGLHAQDTIRMTWTEEDAYMYSKSFKIKAPLDEKFIVDYGDGDKDTLTGLGTGTYDWRVINHYYYGSQEPHTIIVTNFTEDCKFYECAFVGCKLTDLSISSLTLTYLYCSNIMLSTLNLNCPALNNLYCSENQLTTLDVSKNTELWVLDCFKNQLTILDLSQNTKLVRLDCSDNLLTDLNISGCTEFDILVCRNNRLTTLDLNNRLFLRHLNCSNNQLTVLTLSNNTKLKRIYCNDNQLMGLDISNMLALEELICYNNQLSVLLLDDKTTLFFLDCSDNRLQLSDLYNVSKKISSPNDRWFGTQKLLPQKIIVGDSVDFSAQSNFEGKKTVFSVKRNDTLLYSTDYTINTKFYSIRNGIITFKDTGTYKITMTNPAIVSHPNYPAEVIAEFHVVKNTIDDITEIIKIQSYELRITNYELRVTNYELQTLNIELFDVTG